VLAGGQLAFDLPLGEVPVVPPDRGVGLVRCAYCADPGRFPVPSGIAASESSYCARSRVS
jgi:hypothetical protein